MIFLESVAYIKHRSSHRLLIKLKQFSYLSTVHAMVVRKVLIVVVVVMVVVFVMVVVVVVVMVMMNPKADCSCLCLAFSDQPADWRSGGFWSAVSPLVIFIWLHHQLSAVDRRGAAVHDGWAAQMRGIGVAMLVLMVAVMVMVVVVLVVAGLLVMLHRNSPDAIQPYVLQEALQAGQRDGAIFSISGRSNGNSSHHKGTIPIRHSCVLSQNVRPEGTTTAQRLINSSVSSAPTGRVPNQVLFFQQCRTTF